MPGTRRRNPEICEIELVHPEKVRRIRALEPGPRRLARMAEIFGACADATRLRLLLALAEEELCVCDLAAAVAALPSGVSHHLRLLRTLRLVQARRSGRMVYYRLDDEHVRDLLRTALAHVEH